MYISKATALNFKGRTFSIELDPMTVFVGKNMSGKSAVAECLRVLLLGYSPRHGKQAKATCGFAGSKTGATLMKLGAEITGDPSMPAIGLSFELVKSKWSLAGTTGGPFPIVSATMLDVKNEFLAKSGPDKVRFIFEQIDLDALGFTTERVTARLKKDVKVAEVTEGSEAALTAIVDDVENLAQERDELKLTAQEWMNRVVNRIKDDLGDAEAVLANMEGMIQGTTQLRAQDGLTAFGNVESDLTSAREVLQNAITAKQVAEKQAGEFVRKTALRESLTKSLAGTDGEVDKLKEAEDEYEKNAQVIRAYVSKTPGLMTQQATTTTKRLDVIANIERLTAQIAGAKAKLEEDLKSDCCPHCRSKGKGWKKSLQESVEAEWPEIEKQIISLEQQRDVMDHDLSGLQVLINEAKANDDVMESLAEKSYLLNQKIKTLRANGDRVTNDRARLAALTEIGEGVAPEKIAALTATAEAARQRVVQLEEQDRQRVAAMQDARRAEQARQQYDEKKIQIEVRKLALKVLEKLKGEMMQAAYVGFMDKVNLFTDDIMPGRLEYRDGEIGYFAGATWVTLDYFSGTEEMLTLIGLSVALTQSSRFKIVFLDEWLRDDESRVAVARRMAELIKAGTIHQAIVIDTTAAGYDQIEGCRIVEIKN